MLCSATLIRCARQMLEEEWRRAAKHARASQPEPRCSEGEMTSLGESVGLDLLPDLLEMVAEHHDRPVHHLAGTIRHRIIEHHFIDESGDSCHDAWTRVDLEVDILINALERLRQRAITQGQWSDAPVTPLMIG